MRLYRRIDDVLHFHEATREGSVVTERWGVVGERGDSREHRVPRLRNGDKLVLRVLEAPIADGFEPWPDDGLESVVIEYVVDGEGTQTDRDKREDLEQRMEQTLGLTGLGHCDGGGAGRGTMEVFCGVVDAEIAVRVIEMDLFDTAFADYRRVFHQQ